MHVCMCAGGYLSPLCQYKLTYAQDSAERGWKSVIAVLSNRLCFSVQQSDSPLSTQRTYIGHFVCI